MHCHTASDTGRNIPHAETVAATFVKVSAAQSFLYLRRPVLAL